VRPANELDGILTELRQEYRETQAPPFLETRLRAAGPPAAPGRVAWRWGWVLAMFFVLIPVFWKASRLILMKNAGGGSLVESVTEFVPVPGSETFPASIEMSILRVQLQKKELRQYGFNVPLPVDSEVVLADFVVGDDGLARAVRLVR
jgi:hypothetical protein